MIQKGLTYQNTFNLITIKRFMEKIKPGENGCMEWTGAKDINGYGAFNVTTEPGKTTTVKAHRWMLQFVLKKLLPSNVFACHKCDNPECVNPKHLFAGSNLDNVKDMLKKGRNQSKLIHDDVRKIRQESSDGVSDLILSKKYKLDRKSISNIRRRVTWSYVE
jgi:hypothetical protein